MNKKILAIAVGVLAVAVAVYLFKTESSNPQPNLSPSKFVETPSTSVSATAELSVSDTKPDVAPAVEKIIVPIDQASLRIIKKLFGTYVTPKNSPVSPERFMGYHAGLDFETFANEKNSDVSINVICSGKLLQKGFATGYGGFTIQSCAINGQAVTVVYGHLRQSSIKAKEGDELNAGDFLANLGAGYSVETDGERKHLHLGIRIGDKINIKGYVQQKIDLSGWMNPQVVLGLKANLGAE